MIVPRWHRVARTGTVDRLWQFIDGRVQEGMGLAHDVIFPATGEVIARVRSAGLQGSPAPINPERRVGFSFPSSRRPCL